MLDPPPPARRAFWPVLAVAAIAVLALQLSGLRAAQDANPFASTLLMDADVYWQWAAAIARGELVGETPFLSAPLYPYVLGGVRALGLGLAGTYALQAGLHVLTGLLLAVAGRRLFGPAVGLLAGLLFFGLSDPAYYTGRILNCTTVVFLATAVLALAEHYSARPGLPRALALGAVVGALCLAHPPMLVTVPVFALWAAWLAGSRRALAGAVTLAAAALTIAPATVHNWLAAKELIPISAQAGITFYHGNQPGADGTYSAAAGVSTDRRQQNIDALEHARRETGEASWRAASRYYFSKGLETWRAAPGAALGLILRKAYWFLTGRVYGDIYLPELEHADGMPTTSRWTPLPLALLTWPALLAVALLVRDPRQYLPLALIATVPLLVVCVFWYSPRYRIPAAPALALGAAWALVAVGRWRAQRRAAAALVAAFAAAGAALVINPARGFDDPATYRALFDYTVGTLHQRAGDLPAARARFEAARAAGHGPSAVVLGDLKRVQGDLAGAIRDLTLAVEALPEDPYARRSLGTALAQAGRLAEAREQLERALELDPNSWEAVSNLGNVLRGLGDTRGAIESYERAIALNPDFGDARYNLAVTLARGVSPPRTAEALEQVREALRRDPGNARYRELAAQLAGDQ